jgi:hypothetical protein
MFEESLWKCTRVKLGRGGIERAIATPTFLMNLLCGGPRFSEGGSFITE